MPLCVVALFRRPVGHDVSSAYSLRESVRGKRRGVSALSVGVALALSATVVSGSDAGNLGSPNTASLGRVTTVSAGGTIVEGRDGTLEDCVRQWFLYYMCVASNPDPELCLKPTCSSSDTGDMEAWRLMVEARAAAAAERGGETE